MTEGNTENNSNRGLIATLGVLCVIIVGLVAAIVVVTKKYSPDYVEQDSGISDGLPEHEGGAQIDESVKLEAEAQIAEYNEIKASSEALLGGGAVTPDEIIKLYDGAIAKYGSADSADQLSMYIKMRNNDLLTKGFKTEALEELLSVDYSMFNAPEQYKYYDMIIVQASELGREDIVSRYEPLRARTKEAYDKNYAASNAAAAEAEAARREGIGWDEWQASRE